LPVFQCPSDEPWLEPYQQTGSAHYAIVNGYRTSYAWAEDTYMSNIRWSYTRDNRTIDIPDTRYTLGYRRVIRKGPFGINGSAGMRDLQDGASMTMLMIETPRRKYSNGFGPFWNAWVYTNSIIPERGINRVDPRNGVPYAFDPGSKHTGGCHVLLGDGAVRFVSENINLSIISNLVRIQDGTPIGEF
jgi:hypothetical protein